MPRLIKIVFNRQLSNHDSEYVVSLIHKKFLDIIFEPIINSEYIFSSVVIPPEKIDISPEIQLGDHIVYCLIRTYNPLQEKITFTDFKRLSLNQTRDIHYLVVNKTNNISSVYLLLRVLHINDWGPNGSSYDFSIDSAFIGGSIK